MTDKEMAKEYAKLNARQYKHNDGIGFCTSEEEVEDAYLAGLKTERRNQNERRKHFDLKLVTHALIQGANTKTLLNVLKDRGVIRSWYYNGSYHVDNKLPKAWQREENKRNKLVELLKGKGVIVDASGEDVVIRRYE